MALTAKPYVVNITMTDGTGRDIAVEAYDVNEAAQAAWFSLDPADRPRVAKVTGVRPDAEALKRQALAEMPATVRG